MTTYKLTIYGLSEGEHVEEIMEASSEAEAKERGNKRLEELKALDATYRLTSSAGKLILFHS